VDLKYENGTEKGGMLSMFMMTADGDSWCII